MGICRLTFEEESFLEGTVLVSRPTSHFDTSVLCSSQTLCSDYKSGNLYPLKGSCGTTFLFLLPIFFILANSLASKFKIGMCIPYIKLELKSLQESFCGFYDENS